MIQSPLWKRTIIFHRSVMNVGSIVINRSETCKGSLMVGRGGVH